MLGMGDLGRPSRHVAFGHRAKDTAISIAMLETAFDCYIERLGETDAFDLIEFGISISPKGRKVSQADPMTAPESAA